MTATSIYFDTAPFIYLLEGHEQFGAGVADIIQAGLRQGVIFQASVLALMEFSVKPLQLKRYDLVEAFENLLYQLRFTIEPVTGATASDAAQLRAAYPFLRPMDALHLSTAKALGSEVFLTNDRQLLRVDVLPVRLITELQSMI